MIAIRIIDVIRCDRNEGEAKCIYMLRLCVMYEGKLFHDVPGSGPIDYGEEELVLTDGPTPSEWGEPCAFSFDSNIYAAEIRPVDGSITWMSFRRIADPVYSDKNRLAWCMKLKSSIEKVRSQMMYRAGCSRTIEVFLQRISRGVLLTVIGESEVMELQLA